MLRYLITCGLVILVTLGRAASLLIPMDAAQQNHLKAYGIAYFTLQQGMSVDWLLNYRGGSFLIAYSPSVLNECRSFSE